MKGKKSFTRQEAEKIKILINRKVKASKYDQKRIRDEIRAIGFYFSDFSSKKGYTIADFENLIRARQIEISDSETGQVFELRNSLSTLNKLSSLNIITNVAQTVRQNAVVDISEVELKLISEGEYYTTKNVDSKIPTNETGLYSLR